MAFNKGDIVRIDYKAYIADIGRLYDTTLESVAKEAGIYNEKYKYAPMAYIVGSDKFFKPLDEAISDAEIGKETTIEIASSNAAGPRDPKLVETYSAREFHKKQINPYPGLDVRFGNRTGMVVSTGAGRVKVDFNNPLSGKDLSYTFTVTEVVTGNEEKAKAIVEMAFGTSDGFVFTFADDKVSIVLPDIVKFNQEWPVVRFKIVSDMRDAFKVDTVELIEVWSKTQVKKEEPVKGSDVDTVEIIEPQTKTSTKKKTEKENKKE